ncbi:MAG: DNA-binding MarR family transcriptional regulator [Pseudohongiellaceae bacterium]|jgi:DNA-binding MarR family transcriptional regulator
MFERCLYFNVNSLARKLNARWEQAFAPFNLPPSHGYLLRVVLENPGLTQQKIAEELRLNKSTVTRFISALEKKELLLRENSSKDQRERVIIPSKKAVSLHKGLEVLGDELYSSMCEVLGRNNVESFVKSARIINDAL